MMRIALFSALVLLAAAPALARPRAHARPPDAARPAAPDECMPVAEFEHGFEAGMRFDVLTPGQFHYAQGVYAAAPNMPTAYPPGDGALLVSKPKAQAAVLVWTRGGKVCHGEPLIVSAEIGRLILGESTAPGETAHPDGDGPDLHL